MRRGRPTKAKGALVRAIEGGDGRFVTRDHASIVALTERFHQVRAGMLRDAVESMRELGELLDQGARRLRGHYLEWVREDLAISDQAARNYRRVYELGRTTPGLFVEWKDLGASKMMRLARIDPGRRRRALRVKAGAHGPMEMTDAEFAQATRRFVRRRRAVTANMRAHGLRMRAVAMAGHLRAAAGGHAPDRADVRAAVGAALGDLIAAAREARARLCGGASPRSRAT